MVIEPTDEMVEAAQAATGRTESDDCMRDALAAGQAIVERDRLDGPAAVRHALDEAVEAAIPLAGGPLLRLLKALKRGLDRFPPSAAS